MKLLIMPLALVIALSACNAQSSSYEKAKQTEKAIKDAPRPGAVATSPGGYTMTATINGKKWTATSMMPPAVAGTMVGYTGEKSYLMMYCFEKRSAEVGRKATLGDGYSVDYWVKDGPNYSKYSGLMEITSVNGKWVEGKFAFTANGLTVTDGFYRVEL